MAHVVGDIIDKIKEYIEVKTEQIKLMALARLAKVFSGILTLSIILLIGFFLLFFLSFALAYVLNDALGSTHLGFFLICGFYLLIIIIMLILSRKGIIQGWFESLILNISEGIEDEDD